VELFQLAVAAPPLGLEVRGVAGAAHQAFGAPVEAGGQQTGLVVAGAFDPVFFVAVFGQFAVLDLVFDGLLVEVVQESFFHDTGAAQVPLGVGELLDDFLLGRVGRLVEFLVILHELLIFGWIFDVHGVDFGREAVDEGVAGRVALALGGFGPGRFVGIALISRDLFCARHVICLLPPEIKKPVLLARVYSPGLPAICRRVVRKDERPRG
jgi:hypothetical protein